MTNPLRILIADDDASVRQGASELLAGESREVLEADSGDQALHILCGGGAVHLAVLDFHMPGRTGLEVFEELRRAQLEVPTILWSGEASEGVRQMALERGASAFLRKPVQPALLREEVQRVIERHWGRAS